MDIAKIVINADGTYKIEGMNMKGKSCEDKLKAFNALGDSKSKRTRDYFDEEGNKNTIRRG